MAIHTNMVTDGDVPPAPVLEHHQERKRARRNAWKCAPLVLGLLQRPVAERERVVGLQSHNVACGRGGGDGTAGPYDPSSSLRN